MSLKYKNYSKIILENDFELTTSLEQFLNNHIISFKCFEGHLSELNENSFRNKIAPKYLQKCLSLCGKCNEHLNVLEKINKKANELGFIIMKLNSDNLNLYYKCCCGNISKSNIKSLNNKNRKSVCPKCQNEEFKVDYKIMKKTFEEKGCKLLTHKENYKNNKQLLDFECLCGSISKIIYHDLKRGRLCLECKVDRAKQTSINIYGTDNPSKSDEIKQKIVDTNIEKHGVSYVMQNPEIAEKSFKNSYKYKQYIFPSGKSTLYQGYENFALDILLNIYKIDEKDIITGCENVPEIWYYDTNKKRHRYYTDIFILSQNKCIEVKSKWTFEDKTKYENMKKDNVKLKQDATKSLGYKCEIWVINRKGKILEIIN